MEMSIEDTHFDCAYEDQCQLGAGDRCPHAEVWRRHRRIMGAIERARWSALELRRDSGGLRHFLEGRPVHCGCSLELQVRTWECDRTVVGVDNYEYALPQPRGECVRYEASIWHGGERSRIEVTLYVAIAGHTFRSHLSPEMRFRWPR